MIAYLVLKYDITEKYCCSQHTYYINIIEWSFQTCMLIRSKGHILDIRYKISFRYLMRHVCYLGFDALRVKIKYTHIYFFFHSLSNNQIIVSQHLVLKYDIKEDYCLHFITYIA